MPEFSINDEARNDAYIASAGVRLYYRQEMKTGRWWCIKKSDKSSTL